PETARIGEDSDRAACEARLAREERRRIDELLERAGTDDARLAEQRVDGSLRAREGGSVGARRSLSALRGAALEREDRLPARHAAGEAAEPARVSERLDVQEDRLRRVLVLPPLKQVVRRDVGLVPDRDERGETEAARDRCLEQGQPERAALRREADVS